MPPPGPKPGGLAQELSAKTLQGHVSQFILYTTYHNALVSTLQVLKRITDLCFGPV